MARRDSLKGCANFVALHESGVGTKLPSADVRSMSAVEGEADIIFSRHCRLETTRALQVCCARRLSMAAAHTICPLDYTGTMNSRKELAVLPC